jgi:hypothetical protein
VVAILVSFSSGTTAAVEAAAVLAEAVTAAVVTAVFLTAIVVSAAPFVDSDAAEVAAITIVAVAAVVTAAVALVPAEGLTSGITMEEFFLILSSHAAYLFLYFSLRLSLGWRFLPCLLVLGAAEEDVVTNDL